MHDGKTVTSAQHFSKIAQPATIWVRMVASAPPLSPAFSQSDPLP